MKDTLSPKGREPQKGKSENAAAAAAAVETKNKQTINITEKVNCINNRSANSLQNNSDHCNTHSNFYNKEMGYGDRPDQAKGAKRNNGIRAPLNVKVADLNVMVPLKKKQPIQTFKEKQASRE
jgi:hypothetical protein